MTRSGIKQGQHDEELEPFIELLKHSGVRRYLEVGARQGDTFYRVMHALGANAYGVASDLPGGPWGVSSSARELQACVETLRVEGYQAQAVWGDVADASVLELLARLGPYDAIFIDADHRYESALRDWHNFRKLAPIVAFHDVAAGGVRQRGQGLVADVERLWHELKTQVHGCRFEEFIHPDPARPMGIGVVLQSHE